MKWYTYLNNRKEYNLLANEKINDDNLIVCHQLEKRRYTIFKDHLHFKTFQERINENENCFYEIVLEKQFRKPYFDIDFHITTLNNKEELEKDIIENLKSSLSKLLEDAIILIYSSHTEKKLSFHVIINNYYFTNHEECKNFYDKTIENIKEEYREYFDSSVYKTVQQFRILNSHKYEKDNKKIFREDLSLNFKIPAKYKKFPAGLPNYLLQISLISRTSGAKYLDGYNVKKSDIQNKISIKGFSSTSDLEDILNIFYSIYSSDIFEYLNVIDNDGNLLITFRRLSPSYCEDCQRVHENENPFITVNGIYRNIYFYCRRKDSDVKGKHIGSLGPEIIPDLKLEDIPVINIKEEEEDIELPTIGMSIVDKMKNMSSKIVKPKAVILTNFLKIQ